MNEWMNEWISGEKELMNEWMNEWISGQKGWMS